MRALFNRWRRYFWRLVFYHMIFGERSQDGQPLPCTRIAPSTCIEGESGLQLADHIFIGHFNFLDATAGLCIGEGVQITNFVSVITHSSHRSIRLLGRSYANSTCPKAGFVSAPVEIGPYSFIGPHSLIEPGARIGRGAVVCAYTQIRGTVPDFAIMAGAPASQVGDVRDALLLQQHPELAAHYQAWALRVALIGQLLFLTGLALGLQIGGLEGAAWGVSISMSGYFFWFFLALPQRAIAGKEVRT